MAPGRLAVGLLLLGLAGPALAAAGQGASVGLPNGDFEAGLAGWIQSASDGSSPFLVLPSPAGTGSAASCDLAPGIDAQLELRVPIGSGQIVTSAPPSGKPGLKLEFGLWVWPGTGSAGGRVWVSLEAHDGVGSSVLAESARVQVHELPMERWTFLATTPLAPHDARVPSGALEMRYRLHCEAQGPLWFDTALAGPFEYAECEVRQPSFENWNPATGAWQTSGEVSAGPSPNTPDGYYGRSFALLGSDVASSLSQVVSLDGDPAGSAPTIAPGREVEAGVWLHLDETWPLSSIPQASTWCELRVHGLSATNGSERLLASGRWYPLASQLEHWVFLQTTPVATVDHAETSLRIELAKSFGAQVVADFVQLGERHGIDGNPRRRVGCNYVGRYRSPHFPGATTDPQAPQSIWRNWCWLTSPSCNNSFVGFHHNPDCATNPGCFRSNGRRDVAVSTLDGLDQVPLVGAYDSRDPEILRYHIDLARAAGIDHFIYDYQGLKLALQITANGSEPLNEECWQGLVAAAEAPGTDIKLAVMYEPKVHFLGWVSGEPTKALKISGIVSDLAHLANTMRGKRCALRRDGRLLVFVFRNWICDPWGNQCLDELDWQGIHQSVLALTGEDILFVADSKPGAGSVLQGFTRWQLVNRPFLTYRNYSDVQNGVPTLPVPQLSSLVEHVAGLNGSVRDWVRESDAERVGVVTVWPGFDDSGVGGWGMDNLIGEDGAALCVRVAHDFEGAFYATTAACALACETDWIQIATWNDWNEATRIEPAWHADYLGPFPLGQGPSAQVEQHVFGRLEQTRQWVETFKGQALPAASFRRIANHYLSRAQRLPGVPLYD